MGKNGVHFKGAENFLKIHKILQKWKRNLGKLCPKSFLSNYPKIFWSVWGYFFFLIFKHLGKVRLPWRSFRHLSHPSQKHNISWFPKNLLFTFTVILSNPSESGEEAMLWERKDNLSGFIAVANCAKLHDAEEAVLSWPRAWNGTLWQEITSFHHSPELTFHGLRLYITKSAWKG